jgi:hypothetical protein
MSLPSSRVTHQVSPHEKGLVPNYALERSVKGLAVGAAGAQEIVAPAAHSSVFPRPAQCGR